MATMRKEDLLKKMTELRACSPAVEFVNGFKEGTPASDIWRECKDVSWMCWFAFRVVPVDGFAFGCADRAVRVHMPKRLRALGFEDRAAGLEALAPIVDRVTALEARAAAAAAADGAAAYAAAYAAYAAAAYAAYAAAYAAAAADFAADAAADFAADAADDADNYFGERTEQVRQLHALWPQIAKTLGFVVKAKRVTKQGIFSFVYRFLVKQGRPARDPQSTLCQYRLVDKATGETLCCAAGCLLSDDEAKRIEGSPVWPVWASMYSPDRFDGFNDFIHELQRIHDGIPPSDDFLPAFKNTMASFAALHGLTVPKV